MDTVDVAILESRLRKMYVNRPRKMLDALKFRIEECIELQDHEGLTLLQNLRSKLVREFFPHG